MANRRNLTVAWVLLLGASFIVTSQVWYTVTYDFNGASLTLTATGLTAWSMVNAAQLLSAILLVAIALSRGKLRTSVAFAGTALLAAVTANNLLSLPSDVPPMVNAMVEKASGVSGGGLGGSSQAIIDVLHDPALVVTYGLISVLTVIVAGITAVSSRKWVAKTADKYSKPNRVQKSDESKGDNIALWDSQR